MASGHSVLQLGIRSLRAKQGHELCVCVEESPGELGSKELTAEKGRPGNIGTLRSSCPQHGLTVKVVQGMCFCKRVKMKEILILISHG